eukprot:CAMPEP_0194253790 /NCGR_PEP_ID=MMETSP0158-20130606/30621_1 /TAXON_ID=33649 /ORGANISM="Thalassionema nitzschioides, Strain L26-B" /LENGTH=532 /DNA_ID=CAMNT_0038991599 /DNA_START=198 /DNA_END=1793 /DNA_ORIENTATION=-
MVELVAASKKERKEQRIESPFVDLFRGSANYIARHRHTTVVFHIPSDLISSRQKSQDNDAIAHNNTFAQLMNDIALTWVLGVKIVLVVGSSSSPSRNSNALYTNDKNQQKNLIVTNSARLQQLQEEAGQLRMEIERHLTRANKDIRVVSGNFISAQPLGILDGVDYQYSGFVRRLDAETVKAMLTMQQQNKGESNNSSSTTSSIVILSPLGISPSGEVYSIPSSEYMAAYVGGALGASKVMYISDEGMELQHKVHGTKIHHLRTREGSQLLEQYGIDTTDVARGFLGSSDEIDNGDKCIDDRDASRQQQQQTYRFLSNLAWSIYAMERGVKRVHLISPGSVLQELYTTDGEGTMISADLYDGIRPATIKDIPGIQQLLTSSKGMIRDDHFPQNNLEEYHVYTRDDLVIATGQVKFFGDNDKSRSSDAAEISSLVVHPAYRHEGRGYSMLGYLERFCIQQAAIMNANTTSITTIFILSTQTMDWFLERGFREATVDCLPPSRRGSYNTSTRNSKVYTKQITNVRDLDAAELFW